MPRPEVSRFYGIVIQIYYGDHAPPHFHAIYAGEVAKVAIETLQVIDLAAPRRWKCPAESRLWNSPAFSR